MEDNPRANWPALILIAIFFTLLIAVFVVVGLGNKKKSSQSVQTPITSSTPLIESLQVSISKVEVLPATVRIKKGGSISWTNKDSAVHRIVSDPHPAHTSLPQLDSESLGENDSYNFTFEKTGTFLYHDENNPLTIKGTVIVE